jgi:peptide/nickel transport system permease protein
VLLPESVVDVMLADYGTAENRAALEKQLGLDGSLVTQYLNWTGISWFYGGETGVLQGDLGESLYSKRTVVSELEQRVPVSFELGLWAQLTAIAVAIPLGVWAALRQDGLPDYGLRSVAILLNSVPGFWIAVLIITFGSIWFNWAPALNFKQLWVDPWAHFNAMLVPALIVGLTPSGALLRLVRTQMLEVLRQDYVRTAQSKGLGQYSVVYKHALRNALIPIVTVIGVGLPNLIAGTVIFEQIFVIPGMGRYLVDAINHRDYPVIMALNLVFATLLSFSLLLVDLTYGFIDPRIRFK